jgi:hypothetical protein
MKCGSLPHFNLHLLNIKTRADTLHLLAKATGLKDIVRQAAAPHSPFAQYQNQN